MRNNLIRSLASSKNQSHSNTYSCSMREDVSAQKKLPKLSLITQIMWMAKLILRSLHKCFRASFRKSTTVNRNRNWAIYYRSYPNLKIRSRGMVLNYLKVFIILKKNIIQSKTLFWRGQLNKNPNSCTLRPKITFERVSQTIQVCL